MRTLKQDSFETLDTLKPPRPQVEKKPGIDDERPPINRHHAVQMFFTSAPLVVADLLALTGAILLAFVVTGSDPHVKSGLLSLLLLLSIASLFAKTVIGLYPGTGLNPILEFRQTSLAAIVIFSVFAAASSFYNERGNNLWLLLIAMLLSIIFVPICRFIGRSLFSRLHWWGQPILIFGENSAGQANYSFLKAHPRLGLRPVGILDDLHFRRNGDSSKSSAYLGSLEMTPLIANRHGVHCAIVAMPDRSPAEIYRIIKTHASSFSHLFVVPGMAGLPSLWNFTFDFNGQPGICIEEKLLLRFPRFIKRVMDLVIVAIGGVLALPVILAIVALIKISSPGPVIYGHSRIGQKGRQFRAWKFRTMVVNADEVLAKYLDADPHLRKEWESDQKLRDDPRITGIGHWLRKTSLDELPQLWNVLRGEMSLVGPRPIVQKEILRYGESVDLYVKVLPGITGLWQISGRNNLPYSERVRLDSYYVRNWSPWMDLYILARTIKVVLRWEGAY